MTVLHAALLTPLDDAYNYKNCTINESLVQERLGKVKIQFGSNLYNFLSTMLTFQVDKR